MLKQNQGKQLKEFQLGLSKQQILHSVTVTRKQMVILGFLIRTALVCLVFILLRLEFSGMGIYYPNKHRFLEIGRESLSLRVELISVHLINASFFPML